MGQNYLEGLRQGDKKMIRAIYDNFYPKVRNFILKNNGSDHEAQDVFHNALYQLTIRLQLESIEIKSSFEGYLFTVCKNLWRKELNSRNKWVRNELSDTLEFKEDHNHEKSIEAQERWELFEESLKLLSGNCRKLLTLYFAKISYQEIVKEFEYSSENVAFQRVFKCKKRLAELIKKHPNYKKLKF